MKKLAFIIAEGFEEIEAVCTIDILRRAGCQVKVLGIDDTTITGSREITLLCDDVFDYYSSLDFDGICFAGGLKNAENLADNSDIKKLIEYYNENVKLIAGICATPAVLFSQTNVLDGREVTSFPDSEFMEKLGRAKWVDKSVVVCDNIITSQSPATVFEYAFAILNYFDFDTLSLLRQLRGK